jgi:predicted nucleotidyltransferase
MSAMPGLPEVVQKPIAAWTKALETELGDDLVGILVHGSVARGEYRPGESGVDAVVVLKQASFEKLEAIAKAMRDARYAARVEATILTEDEIAGAADAFPLLFDEIKRCHILLVGRDPFLAVRVGETHKRLRIEQELRDAQIKMRTVVTDAGGAREAIGGAVARKVKQVRAAVHALLRMKGLACAEDLASVLAKAGEVYGVDVASLHKAREEPDTAYASLTTLLQKTIDDVESLEVHSMSPSRP